MNRRKRRSQLDTIDEINMTPLMDYSIDVSPPKMNADSMENQKSETVNLLANGLVNYRGQVVSRKNLFEILKNLKETSPKTMLFLRADGDIAYRKVIALMKEIKNSGFANISLITVAEK